MYLRLLADGGDGIILMLSANVVALHIKGVLYSVHTWQPL